jgi:septal ring factor EnvC (AmiA/AmiB activator)
MQSPDAGVSREMTREELLAEIADLRRQLAAAERERDQAHDNWERALDKIADLEAKLAAAEHQLSKAAYEIPCAGPIYHRIRVLRRRHAETVATLERERDEARGKLEKIAKLYWIAAGGE